MKTDSDDVARVRRAREKYFAQHPFDPHKNVKWMNGLDGLPVGMFSFPDMDELQIVAIKYAYEFLVSVNTQEDFDAWQDHVLKITGSTALAGIMFGHILGSLVRLKEPFINFSSPESTQFLHKAAAEVWESGVSE